MPTHTDTRAYFYLGETEHIRGKRNHVEKEALPEMGPPRKSLAIVPSVSTFTHTPQSSIATWLEGTDVYNARSSPEDQI